MRSADQGHFALGRDPADARPEGLVVTKGAKAKKKLRSSPKKSAPRKGAPATSETTALSQQSTDPGTSEELLDIEAIEVDISSFEDGDPGWSPASARRAERVSVEEKVEIRGAFGSEGMDHTVRDASLHGVFVETAYLLEVGDPVSLSFPLEDGGRLKVSGRVRWVTPFGGLKDARPGMGIELVALAPSARDTLSSLLHRRARPGSASVR
jgi:hypothetical protein